MGILTAKIKIVGTQPLLQNNPQTVYRFNEYNRKMSAINSKGTKRTDEDYRELADLEVRSRIFFDDELGVYVPASWVISSICGNSNAVAKIAKKNIRGALFATEEKIPLLYENMQNVKTADDIVFNHDFRLMMNLKQGQVRVMKSSPIFHKWSFETTVEFDDKIIDPRSLTSIVIHGAKYGGFGDFRPTFGRATAEVTHV